MTMNEIEALVDDFGRVSAVDGDADLPHSEVWIESRAALLRAVEGIVRERDRLLAERDAANETARRIALTAAGYVGALLAGGPDVVTVSAQRLVAARLPRVEARPGGGVRFTLTDTTLGEALDRIGSASPPPAGPPAPAPEAGWGWCPHTTLRIPKGECGCCEDPSPPAALSTETDATPTKSKED